MNAEHLAALRAQACRTMAALGSVLDSLQLIDDTISNPHDPFADAFVIVQHMGEATVTADRLATEVNDLLEMLERHRVAERSHALRLGQGGPS